MLTNTTWNGVSTKEETDGELTESLTFKPNATSIDIQIWSRDIERTGLLPETIGIEEDGE